MKKIINVVMKALATLTLATSMTMANALVQSIPDFSVVLPPGEMEYCQNVYEVEVPVYVEVIEYVEVEVPVYLQNESRVVWEKGGNMVYVYDVEIWNGPIREREVIPYASFKVEVIDGIAYLRLMEFEEDE